MERTERRRSLDTKKESGTPALSTKRSVMRDVNSWLVS